MPTKTLKNKKSGKRIFTIPGSPVPLTQAVNTKRGITFKLPTNLLEPKNLLKARQKNKANAAILANETRRTQALAAAKAKKERIESQARFATMLRLERERQSAAPVALLPAFAANEEAFLASPRRGPGARGTGSNVVSLPKPTRTIPPNLLRLMRGESLPKALTPKKNNHPNLVKLLNSLSGNRTIRKANLLKAERTASKGRSLGKFWKKEGTNNSNSE